MQANSESQNRQLGDVTTLDRTLRKFQLFLTTEAQAIALPMMVLDYIYGWDISNWQPGINWKLVGETAPDLKYVYIKSTEGTGYVSPAYKSQWDGAGSIGQLRAGYHYHHTELSGKEQAKYFLAHTEKGEIPACIDVEDAEHLAQNPSTALAKAAGQSVYEFTDTVSNAWGQRLVVYTGAWFWNRLAIYAGAVSKSCDYFGATYHALDDTGPYMSIGFSTWQLWQYTSKGKVTGVPDPVDLSVFHGGIEKFNAWHGGTVVVPPPPPPPPTPDGFPWTAVVNNPIFGMYVRTQPRADSPKVKWIPNGYSMFIFETKTDYYGQVWGRMPYGFVAMKYIKVI